MSDSSCIPEIAVIVLNFRGASDTVACVNSLLLVNEPSLIIFICDNNSLDGSEEVFRKTFSSEARVFVLQTGRNGGFAFGNNVGINAALAVESVNFIWILNNDTVVRQGCVKSMRKLMESDSSIGIVGATLVYYDRPEVVQIRGGSVLNSWTSISRHIGNGESINAKVNALDVEQVLDFISGASMFVSRYFVETVGVLSERYFLYFEEADWVARSKGRFKLAYCPEAVIEHKEGASIGSSSANRLASPFSVYHICRSRLIYTWTHRPWALPTVALRMLRYLTASIAHKHWATVRAISLAMTGRGFR